jgi:myo-inositol catabolism protein IolC
MRPGYEHQLFILAFDHRGSFQKKFFGVEGDPTPEQTARIVDAKKVVFEGFQQGSIASGLDKASLGVLVDEQFGADVARSAKEQGFTLAMPVEKSGQDEFDFEYGERYADHIMSFDPLLSKVLVRFNPEGDGAMNARQAVKLRALSDWLHAHDRKFLFELLVPAAPEQLEAVGGDTDRFDKELRPDLMRVAIYELQAAGVEPDVWKIEGLDRVEDCEAIAEQCRTGGRDEVKCIVLGRGADDAAVDHWLKTGSGVAGYAGFAIGRSIWWDPLKGFVDGSTERTAAATQIGTNYERFIDVYRGLAGKPA